MSYKVNERVILLDPKGERVAIAIIKSYEANTKLYRINYKLKNDETIWIEDVKEDRLILLKEV